MPSSSAQEGAMAGALTRAAGVDPGRIHRAVFSIRGQNVLLDSELAALYGVEVKALNQAVSRNKARFPPDFMFQLSAFEAGVLRSQSVTAKSGRGGRRTRPYAFTEQGVAMLSSVLRSPRAVRVNIEIMRVFVHVRRALFTRDDLADKVIALERKFDGQFAVVFHAIRELMAPPRKPPRLIGFRQLKPAPARRRRRSLAVKSRREPV
jgi:hypothetical protein